MMLSRLSGISRRLRRVFSSTRVVTIYPVEPGTEVSSDPVTGSVFVRRQDKPSIIIKGDRVVIGIGNDVVVDAGDEVNIMFMEVSSGFLVYDDTPVLQ